MQRLYTMPLIRPLGYHKSIVISPYSLQIPVPITKVSECPELQIQAFLFFEREIFKTGSMISLFLLEIRLILL